MSFKNSSQFRRRFFLIFLLFLAQFWINFGLILELLGAAWLPLGLLVAVLGAPFPFLALLLPPFNKFWWIWTSKTSFKRCFWSTLWPFFVNPTTQSFKHPILGWRNARSVWIRRIPIEGCRGVWNRHQNSSCTQVKLCLQARRAPQFYPKIVGGFWLRSLFGPFLLKNRKKKKKKASSKFDFDFFTCF